MMKKFTLTILAAAVLGLTGCATNLVRTDAENSARAVQIEPDLHTVSRGDAEDADEVSLPQNYNPDNYRKMVLQVLFYPNDQENPDRFAKEKSEAVTSLFETEITKLRRFTILSSSQLGQQARRDVKRMQDKGGVPSDRVFRLGREKGRQKQKASQINHFPEGRAKERQPDLSQGRRLIHQGILHRKRNDHGRKNLDIMD